MAYWLGIDTGTGGTRALLLDGRGRVAAGFTAPHEEVQMPHPLWAEQRPQDWWQAAQAAIRGVLRQAGISGNEIAGIGLSGQMHGLVLLDAQNQVIRPAIIWCDQRCQRQVDWIHGRVGRDRVVALTANPMLTGFTAPKLLWVREQDPRSFERARKVLLPKDYIRFCLTGEFACDASDASGTGLFDVMNRVWSTAMIDELDLDRDLLPPTFESPALTGKVAPLAAGITGLCAGTPVFAGAGDQAASAVGNGIVEPGIVSCTIGTSGVIFAHMDKIEFDPEGRVHTFCHAVPGKWHVMGVTQGAGLSLQWFRNHLGTDFLNRAEDAYDLLIDEAAQAPLGSAGLFWLPYLMGERTPHLDPTARGGWIGLTAQHTRKHLIRSLLEGVSYSLQDCMKLIERLGIEIQFVRASGGGARSRFWRQMLADVFDKPIATLETQEGSAYGAALIAMAGAGEFSGVAEACRCVVKEASRVLPQPLATAAYAERYLVFRSLYPALRDRFQAIASLA
ncbi:MAG TPA: xylulokinase [Bryobacterales bacterium]|nr:xylulokinase [Bryobacterales bacterium]